MWPPSTSPSNGPRQGEVADDYGKPQGYDEHGMLAQTDIPHRCGGTTYTGIPAEARDRARRAAEARGIAGRHG